jgi:hypothetical protein
METIILTGESKENANLLLKLARKLNINARKLSTEETEDISIMLSINDGMKTGLLDDEEKSAFICNLNTL